MKIVVGTDGSVSAGRALDWCASFAGRLGAEVVVVHAIEVPVISSGLGYLPPPLITAETRELVRDALDGRWCEPLARAGVAFRTVVLDGNAASAIIEVARTENADLVVAGRRGLGGFAELVLGSTTHQLTHHLDRPLAIVP